MAEKNTSLMAIAGSITANVETKVAEMLRENRLDLPADYSANNALKAMQLAIIECQDRNKRPALEVCTKESIIQTMLSMVVQGLNPEKKQCYPIVYGTKLALFRSYFGAVAVAKRVDPNIEDIVGQVVYRSEKDNFKVEYLANGKMLVLQHIPDIFGKRTRDEIVGAYATVSYKDGTAWSEFRTIDEIKDAWRHSIKNPIDEKGNIKEGTTHYTETADMCRRTVINRVCKYIINNSSDASIVAQYAKQTQRDMDIASAQESIDENIASGEVIDVEIPDDQTVQTTPEMPQAENTEQIFAPEENPFI